MFFLALIVLLVQTLAWEYESHEEKYRLVIPEEMRHQVFYPNETTSRGHPRLSTSGNFFYPAEKMECWLFLPSTGLDFQWKCRLKFPMYVLVPDAMVACGRHITTAGNVTEYRVDPETCFGVYVLVNMRYMLLFVVFVAVCMAGLGVNTNCRALTIISMNVAAFAVVTMIEYISPNTLARNLPPWFHEFEMDPGPLIDFSE